MSARGTVKWFNAEKGYGFIAQDDGGPDVFVHHTAIMVTGYRALEEGGRVEFQIGQGQKGPQAEQVRALGRHEESLLQG
jgi:CspA family cold shock protein